jgi:hypothetical protein
MVVAACAAGVAAGSVGPWSSLLAMQVKGEDGGYGVVTLVAAAVAFIAARERAGFELAGAVVAVVAMGIALAIGIERWMYFERTLHQPGELGIEVSAGWGLVVVVMSAAVGVTAAGVMTVLGMVRGSPGGLGRRTLTPSR